MITLTGPLKVWSNDEGRMHFMNLPEELSGEVRAHASIVRRGFGSVRVECRIGEISWRTSLFPVKSGGYFLPIKIAVCRQADLAGGDEVTVELDLL